MDIVAHMTRHGPMRGRGCDAGRIRWFVVAVALVVLLAGGGFAAYALGGFDRWLDDSDESALDIEPPEALDFPAARAAQPVLDAAQPAPLARSKVEQAVRAVRKERTFGKHTGIAVAPLRNGPAVTFGSGTYIPASTLKNFTSIAALASIGADERFTTSVVRTDNSSGKTASLTLVGGGDPLLATKASRDDDTYPEPATLTDLADQTAKALKQQGISRVRLRFDDSLFKGPDVNPRWETSYISTDVMTPVSALWVDQGVDPKSGQRTTEPAEQAAATFAKLLSARGVNVAGGTGRATAPQNSATVASVESPPLGQIVQHLVEISDNQAAEVVLRHLAISERQPASFQGGATAMRSVLTGLGVPWQQMKVYDGSGLSRDNRVTLRAEVAVLRLAATSDNPDLHQVAEGMPVAGFSGSLADRFTSSSSVAGLGLARAKTGTLTGIHAYAGYTTDARGTPLVFVAIANKVKDKFVLEARAGLDDIAAALSDCACSR